MSKQEKNINEIDEVDRYLQRHNSSPLKRIIALTAVTGVITISGLYYAYQKGIEDGRKLERGEKTENTIQTLKKYFPK